MNYLLICCILTLYYISSDGRNVICDNKVCCASVCKNCSTCVGNYTMDILCCENVILMSNRTCNLYSPPCILNTTTNTTTPNTTFSENNYIIEFFLVSIEKNLSLNIFKGY